MNLIISEQLHNAITENKTIYKLFQPHEHKARIYRFDLNESVINFQKKLYRFVCEHTTTADILHFILSFPTYIFPLKHANTVYSLTESSLGNVNIKGRILYLVNMLRAKYVDILDPVVYRNVCRYYFFKKNRIQFTPGSFTDTNVFKPEENYKKENWFVFLGRFFYVKQGIRLLQVTPLICEKLRSSGFDGFKFIFLGFGQQEQEMLNIVNSQAYKGLPIEIKTTNAPEDILEKSKVIFSLQLRNNYPSKSLLEGLAAGNIPLVTDVGTTRMIAKPGFSYYVPENFSANDIAAQLISILSLDEDAQQAKMKAARNFVINNFTIQASADYYAALYGKFR